MERIGYRIVSHADGGGFRTLAGRLPLRPRLGAVEAMGGQGIFLGTTRAFCETYYTGLADGDDVLLTYAYDVADLVRGNPDEEGEVSVRRARLLAAENLSDPGRDMSALVGGDPGTPDPGRDAGAPGAAFR